MKFKIEILILAALAGGLCGPGRPAAQETAKPAQELLFALSSLEMLNEELDRNADVTLNAILSDAAGSVLMSRHGSRKAMAGLLDRALADSAAEGEIQKLKAEIEAEPVRLMGLEADLVSAFTTELLKVAREYLEGEEEIFLDEVMGEAADAAGLDETKARGMTKILVKAAAKKLRPAPPATLEGLPEGVYVLAVYFQPIEKISVGGYTWRWTEQLLKAGTSFITEKLGKSMTLKRRYRRIVPCHDTYSCDAMAADYLLRLRIESQALKDGEFTINLEENIELLPGGRKIWSQKETPSRAWLEMNQELPGDQTFVSREGRKIDKGSLGYGFLDMVASQARRDVSALK